MALYGRNLTNEYIKAKILLEQEGRCAYCNIDLHGIEVQWDHFTPWAYLNSSGGSNNWVASCSICNRKKTARMFKTEQDIYDFCNAMVQDHGSLAEGWAENTEMWQMQLRSRVTPKNTPIKRFGLLPEGFDDENE